MSVSQSTVRLYINGVLAQAASNKTNGQLDPSLASLYVGDNRGSAAPSNATVNSANGAFEARSNSLNSAKLGGNTG